MPRATVASEDSSKTDEARYQTPWSSHARPHVQLLPNIFLQPTVHEVAESCSSYSSCSKHPFSSASSTLVWSTSRPPKTCLPDRGPRLLFEHGNVRVAMCGEVYLQGLAKENRGKSLNSNAWRTQESTEIGQIQPTHSDVPGRARWFPRPMHHTNHTDYAKCYKCGSKCSKWFCPT